MLFPWIIIFFASLSLLIRSASWFTESSEKIGLRYGLPLFIIGVTIVSIGTSLPELASSLAATFQGQTSVVVANAYGSNVANILLIVGISAIFAGTLRVKRSLIDLDLPLLALATALGIYVSFDGTVTFGEGVILVLGYIIYAAYTLSTRDKFEARGVTSEIKEDVKKVSFEKDTKQARASKKSTRTSHTLTWKVWAVFFGSIIGVWLGADWTVKSLIEIAAILSLNVSVVSMSVLALGTSLPEVVVSVQMVRKAKYELALGNVFGSNVFNILMVIGVPALFSRLEVDAATLTTGLGFLVGASFLYIVSGVSQNIHKWEGSMYLLLYGLFLVKLFGLV